MDGSYARSAFPVRYLLTGGFLALLAAALWMTYTRRLTASRVLLLMMAAGFLLRAAYILYTTAGDPAAPYGDLR